MTRLNTAPNLTGVDDVYESLVGLLDDPDPQVSLRRQSRLILLLANHIGDRQVITEAIRAARD
ncbi:DUF2783 domain-containing protein [Paracoccus jiaweipingae]|uniref:DUF2783 domain-containing protein n=1 Tax=unclassified Paracoccus (in: a-proteobacteria) TaxID=2688777 RepID=UPI0037ADBF12